MAEKKISKTARASTRGKVVLKAWHVARETGEVVSRVKLVNHIIDGKPTTRFGWVAESGKVFLDDAVEYRYAEGTRAPEAV